MEDGRLDTLGRWIWATVCLALFVLAFIQGGLFLVGVVAAAIFAYAILFATIATLARGLRQMVSPTAGQPACSLRARFTSNFRRALVDGPLFLLAFW